MAQKREKHKKSAQKADAGKRSTRILWPLSIFAGAAGIAVLIFTLAGSRNPAAETLQEKTARRLDFEVVKDYPHDPEAFLQGLLFHDGFLYESTGLQGKSTLRRVDLSTGKTLQSVRLPEDVFGEGLALAGDRLIQLTWTSKLGFVYDVKSFALLRRFTYKTEGWGLACDGKMLILSDGSSNLTYLDPVAFSPERKLAVTMNGRPVDKLNELEFIEGRIWANVWTSDLIVCIDPDTGRVNSYLDLAGILPAQMRTGREDVLNGIAYDAKRKRIFVSGKLWPRLFEIRVK